MRPVSLRSKGFPAGEKIKTVAPGVLEQMVDQEVVDFIGRPPETRTPDPVIKNSPEHPTKKDEQETS